MTDRVKGKNKVINDWAMGRKIIMQHWISKNPVMTFTFEIKIWFKVTAHLLSTSTVHVKYKLDTAMERYIIW